MHPIRQRLRRLTRIQRVSIIAVVSMVICVAVWRGSQHPEPAYGGRTAPEWMSIYSESNETVPADRYEAVLAFRAMGEEGLAWLIREALPPELRGWRIKVRDSLPGTASRLWAEYFVTPKSPFRHAAQDLLAGELDPPAASLVPYALHFLRSSDVGERQSAAYWLGGVRKEDAAVVFPYLLQAARDTNAYVSTAGFRGLEELGVHSQKDMQSVLSLLLNDPVRMRQGGAWRILIRSGEAARPVVPLLESMRQSSSDTDRLFATATLLRLNPERTELISVLTNALVSTDVSVRSAALHVFMTSDTRALAAVPCLKGCAVDPPPGSGNEYRYYVEILAKLSPADAVEVLVQRIRTPAVQQDLAQLSWHLGEYIRLVPSGSAESLYAIQTLEKFYGTVVSQSRNDNTDLPEGFAAMPSSLQPESFEKPPPPELLVLLHRMNDQGPGRDMRQAAAQALKYFHLRWPK